MDVFKIEVFKVALFILPGIITLRIKAALSISAPSKPLNTMIDGLAFTLIDHALFGISKATLNAFSHYPVVSGIKSLGAAIAASPSLPGELGQAFKDAGGFLIIFIAAVVGLVIGTIRYHGWDFRLFRRMRITHRTGENLVWAETLTKASKQSYAVVACSDGSRFMGEIDTFSEEAGSDEILLSDASQVQPDGSLLPIRGEGVLLTRENPIVRVELWNPAPDASVGPQGAGNA